MRDYKFKLGLAVAREEKLRNELEAALAHEDSMREELGMVRKAVPNSTLELVSLQQRLTVAERERDAALAREDALREELRNMTSLAMGRGDRVDSLRDRLSVSEQRAAFLGRVMRDTLNDEDGLFITAEFNTGPTWSALQKHGRSIEAALKPAAEWHEEPLHPVEGDRLPAIGRKVFIHLSSSDSWVEHTVTGYYVWDDLQGSASLHRVFIRVRDGAGHHNARLLKDVRLSAEGEGS